MLRTVTRVFISVLLVSPLAGTASAATLPAGFTETPVGTGLSRPTAMAIAPDGRIFVCEQGGTLRVLKDGALLPTPFVSLTVDSNEERGLLGVAFDPAFATNQFVYVYYTATTPSVHNRLRRYTAGGDVAVPGSEVDILDLENLTVAEIHNGGAIHFGPDGKLYVAVGENGNRFNAQQLGNRLGKILRINADGSIPQDNPFYNTATGANRAIWAYGLRNPYTFAIDPTVPRMFINDVGADDFEEVNDGIPGANYGWPDTEGPHQNPAFVSPRYAYTHAEGGCAISGAAFYSPTTFLFPGDYASDYFFADLCGGWIRRLDPQTNTVTTFATGISRPVDLLVANDGSLYYLARGGSSTTGAVFRVQFTPGATPPAPALTAFVNGLTLSLSWTPSPGATSYRLEAGMSSGAVNIFNQDVGNITAIEAVVPAGGYFIRVRAAGPAGVSGPSNEVQVTLAGSGPCDTPPPAPAGYVAQVQGLSVSFAWNASPSATFYIFEAGSAPGAANVLETSVGSLTSFAGAGPAGTYFTRVRSANSCGVSAPSVEIPMNLTCSPPAPTELRADKTGTLVTFSWNASAGATSYRALIGSAPGLSNLLDVDIGLSTGGSIDTSGAPPGSYFVRIVASTPCGVGEPSNEVIVTVP